MTGRLLRIHCEANATVEGKFWPKFKFLCMSAHRVKVCFNIVIVD